MIPSKHHLFHYLNSNLFQATHQIPNPATQNFSQRPFRRPLLRQRPLHLPHNTRLTTLALIIIASERRTLELSIRLLILTAPIHSTLRPCPSSPLQALHPEDILLSLALAPTRSPPRRPRRRTGASIKPPCPRILGSSPKLRPLGSEIPVR